MRALRDDDTNNGDNNNNPQDYQEGSSQIHVQPFVKFTRASDKQR